MVWLATPPGTLVTLAVLFCAGLAVRWPYYMLLPHFTDEVDEGRWALAIARGEMLPLVPKDKYYGPLHHYIVAIAFKLFGLHMSLPRAIVCVIGALTVAAAYLLGRELAGRGAGFLAATLLLTAPQHIIVNSHVAWENSTTPFYATLCMWAFLRATRLALAAYDEWRVKSSPAGAAPTPTPASRPPAPRIVLAFPLAGFLFGLTLQTSAVTILLAPAIVLTFVLALWRQRAWRVLARPWPWAGVLAALIAYSPVLIYNVRHDFAGVARVTTRRAYVYEAHPTWDSYRHNLFNLLGELARMVSNPMRIPARPLHYLTSPYMLIAVALGLLGLALLARRGQPLPLLAILSVALVLPRFSHAYGVEGDLYLLTGRYLAYLLPLCFTAIAAGALALVGWFVAAVPRRWQGLAPRDAVRVVPAVLLVLLVLYPLLPLERYYTWQIKQDPDNATFFDTIRFLDSVRGPHTPILVDRYLEKIVFREGTEPRDAITYLLELHGVPFQQVDDPGQALAALTPIVNTNDPQALPLVVMMRDRCFRLGDNPPLQRISDKFRLRELYWTLPSYYAVYRYAPPGTPGGCYGPNGPQPGD
jgi:4-amino-4-deoxy-L-arabinose transferase-like glycosyltransferase